MTLLAAYNYGICGQRVHLVRSMRLVGILAVCDAADDTVVLIFDRKIWSRRLSSRWACEQHVSSGFGGSEDYPRMAQQSILSIGMLRRGANVKRSRRYQVINGGVRIQGHRKSVYVVRITGTEYESHDGLKLSHEW